MNESQPASLDLECAKARMTGIQTNHHPADRLADIREQIRILKAEEEELREGFIAGDLDLDGARDDYTVVVEQKVNERIDLRRMREHVPESVWRRCCRAVTATLASSRHLEEKKGPAVGINGALF